MSFYSPMEEAQLRFEERVAPRHTVSRRRTSGLSSVARSIGGTRRYRRRG